MQQLARDEVSTLVDAPPDQVYALIADVTRTPEFSPEIRTAPAPSIWPGTAASYAAGYRWLEGDR